MRSCSVHGVFMGFGRPVMDLLLRIRCNAYGTGSAYGPGEEPEVIWSSPSRLRLSSFVVPVSGESIRVRVPRSAVNLDAGWLVDWIGADASQIPDTMVWPESESYNRVFTPASSFPPSPTDYPYLGRTKDLRVIVEGRIWFLASFGKVVGKTGSALVQLGNVLSSDLLSATVRDSPDLVRTPNGFPSSAFGAGMGDVMEPGRRHV